MKRHLGFSGIISSAAMMMLSVQPANAAATQITNVQVNSSENGIQVVLQTRNGDRPQVFTVNRGNALVADIINTQLQLPGGNGFVQNSPVPGISAVTVTQLDANSVRVTISGDSDAPSGQVSQANGSIVLNASREPGAAQAAAPAELPIAPPDSVAQAAPPEPAPAPDVPAPDVLVPDPGISIDGVPVERPSAAYSPPTLPRAVAPPVGDIATATVDSSPTEIDLGTSEVVPRLVLRDAPVRDVLSLLARAAGLNVAYIGPQGEAVSPDGQPGETPDVRVSLDIENEPVQNVFNYVIRIAGLDVNRVGRTVFVGPRLPNSARQIITRTLRLNQVAVGNALNFLVGLGAETAVSRTRQVATVLNIPLANAAEGNNQSNVNQVQTTEEERIEVQRVEFVDAAPILRGLQVIGDERTNSVTLVGNARTVAIAASQLTQLDIRRRQVAVNVKIVDVNLLATEQANTSFSFGVGDTFVSSDNGALSVNFGNTRPPSAGDVRGSRLSPPITTSPFPAGADDLEPFLDAQPDAPFGDTSGGSQQFSIEDDDGNRVSVGNPNYPFGINPRAPFGTRNNPLQPGITDIDDDGTLTLELPDLFQYPTRFLASLQAQVVSGNAKILTDPTLVIQEGQTANVVLAQDVITNITTQIQVSQGGNVTTTEPVINPAGLSLALAVSRIDDNGFITLQVNPTVTAPAETRIIRTTAGDQEITLLSRRDLQSGEIRVRDGQALILSGIIQESDRTTVTKVPILGDIPILGALFRSTQRNNTRQEVIVVLTPRVLDDSDLSTFGYRYTPSQEAQEILDRQGTQLP